MSDKNIRITAEIKLTARCCDMPIGYDGLTVEQQIGLFELQQAVDAEGQILEVSKRALAKLVKALTTEHSTRLQLMADQVAKDAASKIDLLEKL